MSKLSSRETTNRKERSVTMISTFNYIDIVHNKSHKNNCVVRAFALATGIPYWKVANTLKYNRHGNGITTRIAIEKMKDSIAVDMMSDNEKLKDFLADNNKPSFRQRLKFMLMNSQLQDCSTQLTVDQLLEDDNMQKKMRGKGYVVFTEDALTKHTHCTFIMNGKIYDTFDCGKNVIIGMLEVKTKEGLAKFLKWKSRPSKPLTLINLAMFVKKLYKYKTPVYKIVKRLTFILIENLI